MTSEHPIDVIVIGAGPAGLMAAIAAAEQGQRVAVLEHLARPGVKLLATGGGRCNVTNGSSLEEFMARFGRSGRFMHPALSAMNSDDLREFLASNGVPTVAPDGFLVYPVSNTATTVQHMLVRLCKELRVEIRANERATRLVIEHGAVRGVESTGGRLDAGKVIIATGGRSYPELGATGDGYKLAAQAGHELVEPLPVLVSLKSREKWPNHCSGISLPGAQAWIDAPRRRSVCSGDLLFTHTGVSGPVILDLSREAVPMLRAQSEVSIRINLMPHVAAPEWQRRFDEWQQKLGRRRIGHVLDAHFPSRLADVLVDLADIPRHQTASRLSREHRDRLVDLLTGLPLTVVGHGGFDEAIVTRGGVSLRDVEPRTLESRKTKGLYFAGEVLDLDGPCGGYNLQWAFSSGRLAGRSAASAGP